MADIDNIGNNGAGTSQQQNNSVNITDLNQFLVNVQASFDKFTKKLDKAQELEKKMENLQSQMVQLQQRLDEFDQQNTESQVGDIQDSVSDINQIQNNNGALNMSQSSVKIVTSFVKNSQPSFDGKNMHIMDFIGELEDYFNVCKIDDASRLIITVKSLTGPAKEWAKTAEKNKGYMYFKNELIDEYWSKEKQSVFEIEFISAKYDYNSGISMHDYFIQWLNQVRHLRPVKSDDAIIEIITKHFPEREENILIAACCKDLKEMKRLLTQLDARADKRARESTRGAPSTAAVTAVSRAEPPCSISRRTADVHMLQNMSQRSNHNHRRDYFRSHEFGGKHF